MTEQPILKIAKTAQNQQLEKPLYTPIKYKLTCIMECNPNEQQNGFNQNQNSENWLANYLLEDLPYVFNELEIFACEDLSWKEIKPIGAGQKNTNDNCFMNCILQILYYCPLFINLLDKLDMTETSSDKTIFHMVNYLKTHMTTVQKCKKLAPTTLFKNLGQLNPKFADLTKKKGGQDAYLFFKTQISLAIKHYYDLDTPPTNKMKELCPQSCVFLGKVKKVIECHKCDNEIDSTDSFMDIPISLNESNDLQTALNANFNDKIIKNFSCGNCKNKIDAKMKSNLQKFPGVLCLYIRRYDMGPNGLSNGKNKRQLNFKEEIFLERNNDLLADKSSSKNLLKRSYKLFGLVQHKGDSIDNGHYTSVFKGANRIWHQADDESVKPFNLGKVDRSEIFMLFYGINQDEKEQSKIMKVKETIYNCVESHEQIQKENSRKQSQVSNHSTTGGIQTRKMSADKSKASVCPVGDEYLAKLEDQKKIEEYKAHMENQDKINQEQDPAKNRLDSVAVENRRNKVLQLLKAKKVSGNDLLGKRLPDDEQKGDKVGVILDTLKKLKVDEKKPVQKKIRLKAIPDDLNFLGKEQGNWNDDAEDTDGSSDIDEELLHEEKKAFENENDQQFNKLKRMRDEYDMDYDKGKVKKVRAKKEKQKLDFDKTAKHMKRQRRYDDKHGTNISSKKKSFVNYK